MAVSANISLPRILPVFSSAARAFPTTSSAIPMSTRYVAVCCSWRCRVVIRWIACIRRRAERLRSQNPLIRRSFSALARRPTRRVTTRTTSGLLQSSHQIAPDPLDHVPLVVEKVRYRPQQWLQAQALSPLLHQFPISKTDLSRRRSRHRSALLALRRFRPFSLQRLDVARRSL